ncbi:MAG TPA: hypothetical protein VI864_08135 [Candidatus Bathyarchaeia archaeon]|nr:hypothetical protein [Candidatus Bathyarchaeia archaeon]
MNAGKLTIRIKAPITPESAEILEEKIRDLLRNCNIEATINDSITGNTTLTTAWHRSCEISRASIFVFLCFERLTI